MQSAADNYHAEDTLLCDTAGDALAKSDIAIQHSAMANVCVSPRAALHCVLTMTGASKMRFRLHWWSAAAGLTAGKL